ncbi:unnamed protein product [Phytophthora lilii]|uniref:Unnamed protein product n=1 Tax=Phytophthora lilii TaxID=2077276 RepID=A0A9W6U6L3_9STRA|nr:unnamed protein product [Phytophthora lilii]
MALELAKTAEVRSPYWPPPLGASNAVSCPAELDRRLLRARRRALAARPPAQPHARRREGRAQGPAAAGVHAQCAGPGGAEGRGEAVLEAHHRGPRHAQQRGRPGAAGPVHRRRVQQPAGQQHAVQGAGGPYGGPDHQQLRESVGAAGVPQGQAHDGVCATASIPCDLLTDLTVFCGKILVFLSFTFALSERSAVNLTGKANVTNVTVFEDQDAFDLAEATDAAKASEVVPGLEIDNDPSADVGPIDYNLYRTFWDLQSFFREHQLATQSAENWEKFVRVVMFAYCLYEAANILHLLLLFTQFTELNVVLAAFEGNAFSPDDLERSRDLSGGPIHSTDVTMHEADSKGVAEQGSQEHFFQPKYLTNSRLFRLQLRDPILRECMLTQFLILFNDLSRAKPPVGSTTPKAKFADLTERVVALLKQTPSDGEGFNEMVSYVLERERNWVKWKQEKCPGYEKYPPAEEKDATSAPKQAVKRARRQLTSPLLEQILSESSKPSQILEKIKGKERVPLTAYTDRFKEAWDPENGIEEEYWPDKDEMVCWRTMRAAMKASVNHLDLAVNGTGALVKGILGIETNDASKDAGETSTSTPRLSASSSPKAGDSEQDAVKTEQTKAKEFDGVTLKDSSAGNKRERSDSFKRAQNGNEPPVKRERVGRIHIRDDDTEVRLR